MTKKNENPLADLIAEAMKISEEAPSVIDKRNHVVAAKQIEAIGRLIKTILDLDTQNQKIEKSNIGLQKAAVFLGVIALLFTVQQVTNNIGISMMITFVVSAVAYFWIRKN